MVRMVVVLLKNDAKPHGRLFLCMHPNHDQWSKMTIGLLFPAVMLSRTARNTRRLLFMFQHGQMKIPRGLAKLYVIELIL